MSNRFEVGDVIEEFEIVNRTRQYVTILDTSTGKSFRKKPVMAFDGEEVTIESSGARICSNGEVTRFPIVIF